MADVIILGKGPAGISASLYTVRANINTLIIGKDLGSVGRASHIENYYGFEYPISGNDLGDTGILQASRLGARILTEEVVSIGMDQDFSVTTNIATYHAKSLIIATGAARAVPNIPGIADFEGRGISYCALCDGFFYRDKAVAVLGSSEFALHEAKELTPIAGSVTLLTNGTVPIGSIPSGVSVDARKIVRIYGNEGLDGVEFSDGATLPISGLFIAYGTADSTALARKLGIATEGNSIAVDGSMATNIPGIFAAGDCTGGVYQINKAVYQGATAGTSATKFVRGNANNAAGNAGSNAGTANRGAGGFEGAVG